ncbi:MAG: helix-turn-helix transcriptional regulator [Gaiellaceae bacterium]
MERLAVGDVRVACELAGTLAALHGPAPFPLFALEALRDLIRADAAGYCEPNLPSGARAYELVTRDEPNWLDEALARHGLQDPLHAAFQHDAADPVAVSDFVPWRSWRRLDVYNVICRPLHVADSIRLYLPAPPGKARFFFFDRSRRGFSARDRALLRVLRPHLTRRAAAVETAAAGLLSGRERDVLRLVAAGATNAAVARTLWISEHTVRKHLEHVYQKIGVRTRTAAAAAWFSETAPLLSEHEPGTGTTPVRRPLS